MLERNIRENEAPRTVPKGTMVAARRNQVRLFYISFFCSFLIFLVIYLYLVLFPLTSVYAAFCVDLTTGRHVELVFFNSMHFPAGSARSRGFSDPKSRALERAGTCGTWFLKIWIFGATHEKKGSLDRAGLTRIFSLTFTYITRVPM